MSTPNELAGAAKCYCFDDSTARAVTIYLLNAIANTGMTPSELSVASKCYCFDETTQNKVIAYLLDAIAVGGVSGGSTLTCGDYSGGEPDYTPVTGCGLAVDTSDGRIWWYYSGAWH